MEKDWAYEQARHDAIRPWLRAVADKRIPWRAKLVCHGLAFDYQPHVHAFVVDLPELVRGCGLTERTIRKHLKLIASAGLISVLSRDLDVYRPIWSRAVQ